MVRFRLCELAGLVLSAATLLGAAYWSAAPINDIPTLTVCQALRDPGRYAGQTVIVVGRSTSTSEGSWVDEDCGLKLLIQGRSYGTSISTAYVVSDFAPPPQKPKGFKWDKRSLQRALDEVKKTTRLSYKAHWVAIYGRLETAPARTLSLGSGRVAETYGYGHLSGSPAQIIAGRDGFKRL